MSQKSCKNCYYRDPCDGEESIFFELIWNDPTLAVCGFGFTEEEIFEKNYGHLIHNHQCCPEFQYPFPVEDSDIEGDE
jgi:hypothetical protein